MSNTNQTLINDKIVPNPTAARVVSLPDRTRMLELVFYDNPGLREAGIGPGKRVSDRAGEREYFSVCIENVEGLMVIATNHRALLRTVDFGMSSKDALLKCIVAFELPERAFVAWDVDDPQKEREKEIDKKLDEIMAEETPFSPARTEHKTYEGASTRARRIFINGKPALTYKQSLTVKDICDLALRTGAIKSVQDRLRSIEIERGDATAGLVVPGNTYPVENGMRIRVEIEE